MKVMSAQQDRQIDFSVADLFDALDAQRRERKLSWQGVAKGIWGNPPRSTHNVTITPLAPRRSPAWRRGATPRANMRFSSFGGWTGRRRASYRAFRLTQRGPHFLSPGPIGGLVGIFRNFMTRWTGSAANGASPGRNSRVNCDALPVSLADETRAIRDRYDAGNARGALARSSGARFHLCG